MTSNPMQRQARNFFLLGMFITLLIAGAIVALLFMQMKKINEEKQKIESSIVEDVYVLTKDVKSGDVLTSDMFIQTKGIINSLPEDYRNVATVLSAYSLYTKDGNRITSEYSDGKQHLYINGDKNSEVFIDDATGNYYTQKNGDKTFVETTNAPVIAKISAKANTIVTQSLIGRSDEVYTDDVRKQEYNTVVLPTDLNIGDFIDVRLLLPNGQDYIVVSKKRVEIPNVNGELLSDTIQINLAEEETLTMSCAIVEAYMMDGAKLYATKYTEAGLQKASSPTYVVNKEVASLMESDSNIVEKAKAALRARYNSNNLKQMREDYINPTLSQYHVNDNNEFVQKMEESIKTTQEDRQKWLQSVTATP